MKKKFLIIMLTINLVIGSSLGYLLTTVPSPQTPEQFVDLAMKEQAELGAIGSEILNKQLADFEAEVLASARLLEEIFLNQSQIPQLPIYYHDLNAIGSYGMSDFPSDIFISEEYDKLISLIGSAYQIASNTFSEDYRDTYLQEATPSVNPHTKIPASVLSEIIQTGKLDHIFPTLYQAYQENIWLYFGSEQGYSRSYPFSSLPRDWNPKEESWYQSAATGAKDVIILYDKSGSMEGERREGAVNATKNIISQLGGRDRFNLVAFSDRITTFTDTLSLVSEENLESVNNYIDSIIYGGTTDYDLAFQTGFEVLEQYGNSRNQPVIIFMTDGSPTIGIQNNVTLIERIEEYNGGIDAEIILFGIGADADQQLLSDIAVATDGSFIQINNSTQIESSISNYQQFLSENRKASLTWSLPRTDIRNQGLVLTSSYPIFVNNDLKGVVAVDISVDSIKNFTLDLDVTPGSYSFIFDLAGNNIVHPNANFNFTNPSSQRQSILELENNSPEFQEMLTQAQVDIASTKMIEYDDGVRERIVSINPIGNTSMIYGLVSTLDSMVPQSVFDKLDNLSINQFSFVPGIILGVISSFILVWQEKRITKEDETT